MKRLKKHPRALSRIKRIVVDVEEAANLRELTSTTKLSGSDRYYRVRVGDYRIGIALIGETAYSFAVCIEKTSTATFRDPGSVEVAT